MKKVVKATKPAKSIAKKPHPPKVKEIKKKDEMEDRVLSDMEHDEPKNEKRIVVEEVDFDVIVEDDFKGFDDNFHLDE